MSQRAYAVAVRDKIRSALNLEPIHLICDVMFDGQPNPACGEWFYAVYAGDWRGTSEDADLQEEIGVCVTVTRRLGFAPKDRWGPEVWAKANEGLDVQLRKIVANIHHKYDVMNNANTIIEATNAGSWGFNVPLLFLNGGKPEPKGPDWFSADEGSTGGKFANAGVAQTLTFGRAQRCQPIESMT